MTYVPQRDLEILKIEEEKYELKNLCEKLQEEVFELHARIRRLESHNLLLTTKTSTEMRKIGERLKSEKKDKEILERVIETFAAEMHQ